MSAQTLIVCTQRAHESVRHLSPKNTERDGRVCEIYYFAEKASLRDVVEHKQHGTLRKSSPIEVRNTIATVSNYHLLEAVQLVGFRRVLVITQPSVRGRRGAGGYSRDKHPSRSDRFKFVVFAVGARLDLRVGLSQHTSRIHGTLLCVSYFWSI